MENALKGLFVLAIAHAHRIQLQVFHKYVSKAKTVGGKNTTSDVKNIVDRIIVQITSIVQMVWHAYMENAK